MSSLLRRKALTGVGPGYGFDPVFDLSKMRPYSLLDLILPFRRLTRDVVLYLPRTSDMLQIANAQETDDQIPVVHYCMEGASKVSSITCMPLYSIDGGAGIVRILWRFCIKGRLKLS